MHQKQQNHTKTLQKPPQNEEITKKTIKHQQKQKHPQNTAIFEAVFFTKNTHNKKLAKNTKNTCKNKKIYIIKTIQTLGGGSLGGPILDLFYLPKTKAKHNLTTKTKHDTENTNKTIIQ